MLLAHHKQLINLLANRVASGRLTQLSLAKVTGVHQSQISRILSGNVRRTSKNVLKLCNYAESFQQQGTPSADIHIEVLAVISELLGENDAENLALAQLVASLSKWRKTWEQGK